MVRNSHILYGHTVGDEPLFEVNRFPCRLDRRASSGKHTRPFRRRPGLLGIADTRITYLAGEK